MGAGRRVLICSLLAGFVAPEVANAQTQLDALMTAAAVHADRGAVAARAFDYPEACKWYALATALAGDVYRDLFEGVSLLLTAEERAACIEAARSWRPEVERVAEAANPEDYYAPAMRLSDADLREAIHEIISGNARLTQGQVRPLLEYTDEDPNAPANVIMLYTGRSEPKAGRARGDDKETWVIEHVWPRSRGFPDPAQPAATDLHHVRPAEPTVKADRGDKDFDFGGDPHPEAFGARMDADSFEPPDQVKGDIARMAFYMDVRYEGGGDMPDLTLITGISEPNTPTLGRLCSLLAWHASDPVSDWERRRNDRIFEKQGNRNPFIDYPEWATEIFSDACN